jgi:hypothetical protein
MGGKDRCGILFYAGGITTGIGLLLTIFKGYPGWMGSNFGIFILFYFIFLITLPLSTVTPLQFGTRFVQLFDQFKKIFFIALSLVFNCVFLTLNKLFITFLDTFWIK